MNTYEPGMQVTIVQRDMHGMDFFDFATVTKVTKAFIETQTAKGNTAKWNHYGTAYKSGSFSGGCIRPRDPKDADEMTRQRLVWVVAEAVRENKHLKVSLEELTAFAKAMGLVKGAS
jgi:hypothetical protein